MSNASTPDSYIDAQEKLMTLNLLQMAFKKFDTLETCRSFLQEHGVEVSVANLSRYINGKAIPKSKLKNSLLKVLIDNKELGLTIKELIIKHLDIKTDETGMITVNNTYLLNDSKTLKAILFLAIQQGIIPREVDKVITAEVDGIPIAMTLAHLLNIDCVYARKKKPIGTSEFHSEDIISANTSRMETIYFPDKFIRKNERVIIIDDIIRSGATQTALVNLVNKCEGIPLKIIILTGVGGHWEKTTKLKFTDFKTLVTLK
ncbi:MAG: hypothetical protein GOP50_00330 [Candidatus Heimdallarchaeota archaeon]|nr:hypothetical protein [Candidatus Heimdallarchaeota archaeon]